MHKNLSIWIGIRQSDSRLQSENFKIDFKCRLMPINKKSNKIYCQRSTVDARKTNY